MPELELWQELGFRKWSFVSERFEQPMSVTLNDTQERSSSPSQIEVKLYFGGLLAYFLKHEVVLSTHNWVKATKGQSVWSRKKEMKRKKWAIRAGIWYCHTEKNRHLVRYPICREEAYCEKETDDLYWLIHLEEERVVTVGVWIWPGPLILIFYF